MAEPSTIARPYAEAAFRLADAQGKLADWSATLANLSRSGGGRARARSDRRSEFSGGEGRRAVHFDPVREAHRRGRELRARAGGKRPPRRARRNPRRSTRCSRTSAKAWSRRRSAPRSRWTRRSSPTWCRRLEKKTGRKVKARVSVDKSLIGGVKIVLGDKVIDGSARAQLGALENALSIKRIEAGRLRSSHATQSVRNFGTHQEPHPEHGCRRADAHAGHRGLRDRRHLPHPRPVGRDAGRDAGIPEEHLRPGAEPRARFGRRGDPGRVRAHHRGRHGQVHRQDPVGADRPRAARPRGQFARRSRSTARARSTPS